MQRIFSREAKRPVLMAGPCSAESIDQMHAVAKDLAGQGIDLFRAGVWKPRSRPDTFNGSGEDGLKWLREIKEAYGLRVSTEVATPRHVELALKHGMDALWIGARTVVNPFLVQDLADAVRGADIPVIVKNPINPDLYLWLGAIERFEQAGIEDISIIHRGFSFFNTGKYRNSPMWQIPIDLRALRPQVPILCDISHISGRREILGDVAQAAMDLAYDGLMVEVHHDPARAKSDSQQQISPGEFEELVGGLVIREQRLDDVIVRSDITALRNIIDALDEEIVAMLAKRMERTRQIGEIKLEHEIPVLQPKRWQDILKRAKKNGLLANLTEDFIEELFKAIHQESIHHQIEIMNAVKLQN